MRFERLEISHFRNLSTVALDLNPGLNFFFGPNGAGKTAVLEAVHLLARGRSFRTLQARDLVQQGNEVLSVRGRIIDEERGAQTVALTKSLSGDTQLKINGQPEQRLSEAARLLPLQVMLPDIGKLVFGSPQVRRQWLDWGTFHVKPEYLRHLREYLRILKQRNAALKHGMRGVLEVEPWTLQLADVAKRVDELRAAYVTALEPHFADTVARLTPELDVRLVYRRGWPDAENLDKVLGEWGSREVKLGSTQAGPHRADVALLVGDSRASAVLSRGQGKAIASALIVSQARLLGADARRSSVFLIDDVGAELDESHNSRFFEMLNEMGCQILATSTHGPTGATPFAEDRMSLFHVEHGVVHRRPNG